MRGAMDATRRVRATGMMQETKESNPLTTNPIPVVTMPRDQLKRKNVPRDGNCLFHSLFSLYEFARDLDPSLKARVDHVARHTTEQPTHPWFSKPDHRSLRQVLVQIVTENWDHWWSNRAFKDELVTGVPNTLTYDAERAKNAYEAHMLKDMIWGTSVELDAACELFGVTIETWYLDPNAPKGDAYRTAVFTPTLTPRHDAGFEWTWSVVQVDNNHFEWIEPALAPKPTAPPDKAQAVAETYDAQADAVAPGAAAKIRQVAAASKGWGFAAFKQWAAKTWPQAVAGAAYSVAVLYAVYQYHVRRLAHNEAAWDAGWNDAYNDAWINPGNFYQDKVKWEALPKGASVVDAVFAKAEARKLRPAQ